MTGYAGLRSEFMTFKNQEDLLQFFPLETQLSFIGIFNLKSTKSKTGSHHVCNIQKV